MKIQQFNDQNVNIPTMAMLLLQFQANNIWLCSYLWT